MAASNRAQPVPVPRAWGTSRLAKLVAAGLALAALALFLRYAETTFNGYRIQLVTLVAINAILAVSLTLTSGFTGVFSLGQLGFAAIGAYTGAFLTLAPTWKSDMFLPSLPHFLATFDTTGWPHQEALLLACLAGGAVAAVVAIVVGVPLMRLSGNYVAVATMGFLIIVEQVAVNWTTLTAGGSGLGQIPSYTNLWVAYAWMVVTIYASWRIRNSPSGRAMIASRENLIAARAIGVNVLRSRLLAFVVGGFFTGVAGALLAHQIGTVAPNAYYFTTTFTVIIMVVLGGMGSISGAVVGAVILTLAPEYLRDIEGGFHLGPLAVGPHFGLSEIILALGFILVMIFRPQGFFGDRELDLAALGRLLRGDRRRRPVSELADPPLLAVGLDAPAGDESGETG